MADELRPCNDCGAEVGQPHIRGCDVARCLWTGAQAIQCDGGLAGDCCRALRAAGHDDLADELAYHLGLDDQDHDCGEDVWTGRWPGKAEAEEFGWWSVFRTPEGWVQCDKDMPGAGGDLNRLHMEARWDRGLKRWVKP